MHKYISKRTGLSGNQQKVLKIHLYILYGYLAVCTLYYFFHHNLREIVESLSNSNIADSFSAAIAHTLFVFIFGLLVSFITVVSTVNDPKDGTFETRVKSLVNSQKVTVDDNLYTYLRYLLTKNLAFNRDCEINIEIKDYDPGTKAFLIFCEIKLTISNMCRDNDFFAVETKAIVEPGLAVNGDLGTIVALKTFDLKNFTTKESFYNFFAIKEKVIDTREIIIPRNEEIGWLFSYLIWNESADITKPSNWYFVQFQRYTRHFSMNIINKLPFKQTVKVDLNFDRVPEKIKENIGKFVKKEQLYGEKDIPYNVKVPVDTTRLDAFPEDKLQLYIYPLT